MQWLGQARWRARPSINCAGRLPPRLRAIAAIPILVWIVVMIGLYNYTDSFSANTLIVVAATCLIVAAFAFVPAIRVGSDTFRRTLHHGLSIALLFLVLWDPAGGFPSFRGRR